MPANVCPVVPLTFLKAQVKFKFIDICEESKCIDEGLVLEELNCNQDEHYGLLYVRSYGQSLNVKSFFQQVKSLSRDLFIIDDRCLTIPEPYLETFDRNVDLLLYSTGYSKNVELSFGGFAYLSEVYDYSRIELAFKQEDHEHQIGLLRDCIEENRIFQYIDNDWLGDTSLALNETEYRSKVLQQIPIVSNHKKSINDIYDSLLPNEIKQGISKDWRYNINVKRKKRILKEIFASGLFASSHYASIPKIFGLEDCPVAAKCHEVSINLFNDHRVDGQFATKICDIIIQNID